MNKRQKKKQVMRNLSKAYDTSLDTRYKGGIFYATVRNDLNGALHQVIGITKEITISGERYSNIIKECNVDGYCIDIKSVKQ